MVNVVEMSQANSPEVWTPIEGSPVAPPSADPGILWTPIEGSPVAPPSADPGILCCFTADAGPGDLSGAFVETIANSGPVLAHADPISVSPCPDSSLPSASNLDPQVAPHDRGDPVVLDQPSPDDYVLDSSSDAACPAESMSGQDRKKIALEVLSGQSSITGVADREGVSRKFVRTQSELANEVLDKAFTPPANSAEKTLYYLPVSVAFLRMVVTVLVLVGGCSLRGVQEILRLVFDYSLSLGSIHQVIADACLKAKKLNEAEDLSRVRFAALDEIFQCSKPILVVADVFSTYCCLLVSAGSRDGDTWADELSKPKNDKGMQPEATIADAGQGLHSGLKKALPDAERRLDVFHAERELGQTSQYLDNQAYKAIKTSDELQAKLSKQPNNAELAQKAAKAKEDMVRAIQLADDVRTLSVWLQEDVLSLGGGPLAQREMLFDFVVEELKKREKQCPHRLKKTATRLKNQKNGLLKFVAGMDLDISSLAAHAKVSEETVRQVLEVQRMRLDDPKRWQLEGKLRSKLGDRYEGLAKQVRELLKATVRASSVVENLNGRLRRYFYLRREVGGDYLELLRFYLNNHRFGRSRLKERVGRSPNELLNGQEQPHWLAMLGYQPFKRAA